jgi:hypothetical protein
MSQRRIDMGCKRRENRPKKLENRRTEERQNVLKKYTLIFIAVTAIGMLANTAQAVLVSLGSSTWTSTTSGQTINVDYEVDFLAGLYYYNYQVEAPAGNTQPITALEIDVNTAATLVALALPTAPLNGILQPDIPHPGSLPILVTPVVPFIFASTVFWGFPGSGITPGNESVVVAFSSPFGPTLGNGSALDDGPGPWSSINPGSMRVPIPVVPEPTTMIAGALLLLPFGASTLRMVRKNRTA